MKTILLVDDLATMLMGIKAALDKLTKGLKPDLIITDVNMPKMGGMELIKNIRAEAKKNGATGWLVKPVASADLVAAIKQVLPGA